MSDDTRPCPSCGARVPAGADQCNLCGTEVGPPEDTSDDDAASAGKETELEEPTSRSRDDTSGPAQGEEEAEHVYCNQCGLENPLDANFCSRCGAQLRDLPADVGAETTRAVTADLPSGSSPSTEEDEPTTSEGRASGEQEEDPAAMGAQIVWMVGVSVVVVLTFFFVTQWSERYEWGQDEDRPAAATTQSPSRDGPNTSSTGPARGADDAPSAQSSTQPDTDLQSLVEELSGPVDGPVAETIDSLRTVAQDAEGARRRQVQSELVQMYTGAGASGRAALVQSRLADATGEVEDRRRAADLLYQWMRQVEQEQGRTRVADVARHVATAYEAVAEQRTDDLDARTRMGEAYLLTNNPMKGIQTINAVLEADSTFVPARFQKGLALLQINRLEQAVQQFETVKRHTDQQEPFHQQAQRAIEVINERTNATGGTEAPG